MHKPRSESINTLNRCLNDLRSKEYLLGTESKTWEDMNVRYDLVTSKAVLEHDRLTQWLMTKLLDRYHFLFGRLYKKPRGGGGDLFKYHDSHIEFVMDVFSMVLSSLLPVAAIVVLYLVQSMAKRLAIVAVFTAGFSLLLAIATKAKRPENFAATAA